MIETKKEPHSQDKSEAITNQQLQDSTAQSKKQDAKIGKSREWTCVVYPESAPTNWLELLQETFLECYVSPYHNKDTNPDGSPKKAHYHVVLCWAGPTTFSNAKNICEQFGGVIHPREVGSLRGVCRYLCHLDNPEKAQYNIEEVQCFNGADWLTAINLKSDKYLSLEEMQDFCSKYSITSYRLLVDYARVHRKADWYRTLCDNGSLVMIQYLKSLAWEIENNNGAIIPLADLEKYIEDIEREEQK